MSPSILLLQLLLVAPPVTWQEALPFPLERQERTFRAEGVSYHADVGHVRMAADRGTEDGATIELAVVRLRSTAAKPGSPIVFLAGGPGPGASRLVESPIWAPYLELGDVLLLDQRGTGRSRPSLAWSSADMDPAHLFGEREAALAAVLEWAGLAAKAMREQGIDLAAYTTRASADDVADVLAALGYPRARLLAHSYGTHLALEVLRRHESLVERCALLGLAGPDDLLKPAGELEPFVRELARLAAADPAVAAELPDLDAALRRALDRAAREPLVVRFSHPEGGVPTELRIGRFGLQRILLADLGDPTDLVVYPRLIHELEGGEAGLLGWFAAKRYAEALSFPLAFYALRGSSGVSAERAQRIARDARESPFGDARNFPFPEVLAPLGIRDPGDDFRAPVKSRVPVLLVSGTLDANTPPHQAEAVLRTLERGSHLIVEHAGHDQLLQDPRIRERIVTFLAGDEPDQTALALPVPGVVPVSGPADGSVHPALRR